MHPQTDIVQERIRCGDDDRLAGILAYPASTPPRRAILVCPPHPNFAGDMSNNIVVALAEGLAHDAVTLRFDYRGIGDSRIALPPDQGVFDYWDKVEQTRDYRDPLADTAAAADCLSRAAGGIALLAVGYSFGAVTATITTVTDPRFGAMVGIAPPLKRIPMEHLAACRKPCLLTSGTDDFVHDADVAARLTSAAGPRVRFERIAGADHFFRGRETDLVCRVREFIDQHTADQEVCP
jgi:hypothetical protein